MTPRSSAGPRSCGGATSLLALSLALVQAIFPGCGTKFLVPLEQSLPRPTAADTTAADTTAATVTATVRIVGYTTRDGTLHKYEGTVQAAGADSLWFTPRTDARFQWPEGATQFALPRSDVSSLQVWKGNAGKTTWLIVGIVAAAGLVLVIVGLATSDMGGMGLGGG